MLPWKTWNEVWMTKEEEHTWIFSMALDDAVGRDCMVEEELEVSRLISLIDRTVLGSTALSHIHKRPPFLPPPIRMATSGSKGSVSGFDSPCDSANPKRYSLSLSSALSLTHVSVPVSLSFFLRYLLQTANREGSAPSACACKREHEDRSRGSHLRNKEQHDEQG